MSVGGIFATVSLETAQFDRGIARVMKTLKSFADDATRASGGTLKLDEGLASVGNSGTRAASGLDRAGKASATVGTAQQRAAVQAAQFARATTDVAAAMDRTAALGPKVQGATLRLVAAQDRLNAVQEGGVATTRQLASAQAGLIGATRGVAVAIEATAAAAKATSGAFGGMLKTAGELGLVLGGIEIAKQAVEFVGAGKELTTSLNGVQAASHATDAQMRAVRAQAVGLGKDMSVPAATAVDAADAIQDLVRAGMTLPRAMAAARPALLLASAAQVSTADAARILGDTLDDFALPASQATHVANSLAGAATSAGGGLTDMFEALKYVGPSARVVGVSVDDVTASIAELAKSGIQGSMAGTGMRMMLQSLAKASPAAQKALKDLGVEAWDSQGRFVGLKSLYGQLHDAQGRMGTDSQRFLKDITTAFGARASTTVAVFAHRGIEGYNQFAARVKSGDVQKYADLMNRGVAASGAALRKEFTSVGVDLYAKFEPQLASVAAMVGTELPHAFSAAGDVLRPFGSALGYAGDGLGEIVRLGADVMHALGPFVPAMEAAAQTALILFAAFKGAQIARAALFAVGDGVTALSARLGAGLAQLDAYEAGTAAAFAGNATAAERATLVQTAAAAQTAAANAREAAAVQQAAATEAVANAEKVADSGAASRAQIEFADANAAAAMASARAAQLAAVQTATAADTAAAGVAAAGDEAALGWGAIAGPIGIAAAGVAIFAGALFHSSGAAKQNTAEISSLTTAIQNDSGALGENTRQQVINSLEKAGAYEAARKLGLNLQTVTDATVAGGPALEGLTAQLALYSIGSYGATKDTSARVAAARKLAAILGDENGAVGKAVQASKDDAAAKGTSTTATDTNTTAKRSNTTAAATNAAAVAKLVTAEIALINVQLSQAQSQDQFLESVRSTTSQLKGNSGTLSQNTKNGLANRDALLGSVQAALSLKDAQDKAGGSTVAHTRTLANNIASLRAAAIAAGADKGEVDKLLTSLHATPKEIRATVGVETSGAKASIKQLQGDITSIKQGKVPGISANTAEGKSVLAELQRTINRLKQGKAPAININTAVALAKIDYLAGKLSGLGATLAISQGEKPIRRAAGGTIRGPGSGTSDSVLMWGSNGEEVINAKQSAKHRRLIKAINAGVGGFASGGTVGATQSWLRNRVDPLPYVWGASGPGAYDCSGLVGAVFEHLTGKGKGRLFSTSNEGAALRSLGFKAGAGGANALMVAGWNDHHTTGSVGGLKFEAYGSDGVPLKDQVRVGGNARDPKSFPNVMYLPNGADGVKGGATKPGGDPKTSGTPAVPSVSTAKAAAQLFGSAGGGTGAGSFASQLISNVTTGGSAAGVASQSVAASRAAVLGQATGAVNSAITAGIAPDPTEADLIGSAGKPGVLGNAIGSANDQQKQALIAAANYTTLAGKVTTLKASIKALNSTSATRINQLKDEADRDSKHARALSARAAGMATSTKAERAAKKAVEESARSYRDKAASLRTESTELARNTAASTKTQRAALQAQLAAAQALAASAKDAYGTISQAAKDAVSKAADYAKTLVADVQSDADTLTSTISDFKSSMQSNILGSDSVSSLWSTLFGATDADGNPVKPTLAALQTNLNTVLSSTQQFATDLTALVGEGANQDLISQVSGLGATSGDALAQQLLAAGPAAVSALQTTMASIQSVAGVEAQQLATSFYGPGATAMEQFIAGLQSQFPSLTAALQSIANAVAAAAGVTPITITPPSVPAPKASAPKAAAPKASAPVLRTTPHISGLGVKQYYASGTLSAIRGVAVVGERGPELVRFRGGEQVIPTSQAPSWVNRIKHPVLGGDNSRIESKLEAIERAITTTGPAQTGLHVGQATLGGFRAAGASQQRQLRRQGRRAGR